MVQHEAKELASSDVSFDGLPRPLILIFKEGSVVCVLYHGTPVIRQKTGMQRYYCHRNDRSTTILRRRFIGKSLELPESGEFRLKFTSGSSWVARPLPFRIDSGLNKLWAESPFGGRAMAKPVESQLTISCLQCDWSVETVNTPAQVSRAFLEAAHSHLEVHEQHAVEVVQRLRLYSENYVEPEPVEQDTQDARGMAARRDPEIQTGFLDRPRREH